MNSGQSGSTPPRLPAQMGVGRVIQEESGRCVHYLKTVVRKDLWGRVPRPPPPLTRAYVDERMFDVYLGRAKKGRIANLLPTSLTEIGAVTRSAKASTYENLIA
jgi:hypothetical protein